MEFYFNHFPINVSTITDPWLGGRDWEFEKTSVFHLFCWIDPWPASHRVQLGLTRDSRLTLNKSRVAPMIIYSSFNRGWTVPLRAWPAVGTVASACRLCLIHSPFTLNEKRGKTVSAAGDPITYSSCSSCFKMRILLLSSADLCLSISNWFSKISSSSSPSPSSPPTSAPCLSKSCYVQMIYSDRIRKVPFLSRFEVECNAGSTHLMTDPALMKST